MATQDEAPCIVDVEIAVGVYGFPAAIVKPGTELAPIVLQEPKKPVVVVAANENRRRMIGQDTTDNLETPLSISATIDNIAEEDDARRAASASRIILAECDHGLEEIRATVHVANGVGEEHDYQRTLSRNVGREASVFAPHLIGFTLMIVQHKRPCRSRHDERLGKPSAHRQAALSMGDFVPESGFCGLYLGGIGKADQ